MTRQSTVMLLPCATEADGADVRPSALALSKRRKGVAQLAEPTGILITACSIEIADPFGMLPSGCPEPRPTVTHRRSSRSGAMEMRHRTLGPGVGYYPECAGLSAVCAVAECRCMTAHPARKTALPEWRITVLWR